MDSSDAQPTGATGEGEVRLSDVQRQQLLAIRAQRRPVAPMGASLSPSLDDELATFEAAFDARSDLHEPAVLVEELRAALRLNLILEAAITTMLTRE